MSIVNIDPATGREILLFDAFGYNGQYEVKATGYAGSVPNNATSNLDFAIGAEDRYIQGVRLMLKNHLWGDTINLQIIDTDGVIPAPARAAFPLYPVLRQFATNWAVDNTSQDQGQHVFGYVARIIAGVYLRIIYTSTSSVLAADVDIKLNCLLHKKVA